MSETNDLRPVLVTSKRKDREVYQGFFHCFAGLSEDVYAVVEHAERGTLHAESIEAVQFSLPPQRLANTPKDDHGKMSDV